MAYHNRNVSNRRTTLLTLQNQPKMIQAIMKGDIHKVKHLISNGESVNESDTEKRSYLHLAAAINADEIVKILLNAGARVDAKDKSNLTPLHRACRNNNDRVASIMKDSGADVNAKDSVNWTTPLHICAAHNAVECATVIIDKVVNIDATDKGGATALHYSAYNGSCDILTFLLKHGSLPNVFDKEDRRPLHWAATLDNNDAIRILIESGAKVNARDKYLRTPLHYASATGSICAVQSLIENGADPMTVDKEGNTALHLACVNGQDDVMDELLAACDLVINAPNFAGLTPLHFSAASYNGTACLEALTAYQGPAIDMNISEPESYGVECPSKVTKLFVNARDKNQRTPLHLAAKCGRTSRVQELLRVGADPNASDKTMMTPLHLAARQGHTNVIEVLLLQDNVDPNMMDKAGMTPLHHAAFFGLSGCVSMLLKSPKAESRTLHDITGRYPYFLASMAGSLECVELLFPPSCRHLLSKLDNFNRNPLHYAAAAGNAHQCLQYLLELKSEHGDPLFSVNQVDIFGRMPLHYASGADGEGRCIKLLLNAGAKLDTPDSEGYFTLNYAAAAGKLGALQNLLAYSTFAWHRVRFKLCPAHSAAFNGHTECLEVLINSGIYEDLHKSMRYAKICGHSAAYQVINYFISNNDSIYFTADEGNMSASDLSMDVLTSSFSSMNLKCSSQSNMASSPSSPLSAPSTLSPSSRRDSHGHLLLNGTKQSNEQLTNGQHSQPHVEQLNA